MLASATNIATIETYRGYIFWLEEDLLIGLAPSGRHYAFEQYTQNADGSFLPVEPKPPDRHPYSLACNGFLPKNKKL